MAVLNVVLRIMAFLLGVAFLLGYLRFATTSTEASYHIWMVSQVVLMWLCAFGPSRSSGLMLKLLSATASVVVVSSIVVAYGRLSKLLGDEHPETVILIYLIEAAIAAWFIYMHARRVPTPAHGDL